MDLFFNYASNLALYTEWHYFRKHQPPMLTVWGQNDPFFAVEGAKAYLRDLPNAELRLLDTGHFALEEHSSESRKSADFSPHKEILATQECQTAPKSDVPETDSRRGIRRATNRDVRQQDAEDVSRGSCRGRKLSRSPQNNLGAYFVRRLTEDAMLGTSRGPRDFHLQTAAVV